MFQTIQVDEVFDMNKAMASESHPSYWLAQLRKADWQYLLKFVNRKLPLKTKKQTLVTKLVGGIIETRLELALFLNFLVNQLTI